MSSTVFWPGLSVCQGCFMSLSCRCYYSEECQFTFQECHFITFISMLLSPCQGSQGSGFPLPHKSHKLKCWYSFLSVCFCLFLVCQIIIGPTPITFSELLTENAAVKFINIYICVCVSILRETKSKIG